MTTWATIAADAPAFADRLKTIFEAGTNKTMATLRRDGSPRISGTELAFEGERVTLGMMPDSRKHEDVLRDPRVAVHSPTIEPPPGTLGNGDAKFSGVLVPIPPPEAGAPGAYFEVLFRDASVMWVENDELVIESWAPGRALKRVSRT